MSWLQTRQPIYVANSRLSSHNSLLLLGRHYLSPLLPARAVNLPWMGLVLNLGAAGVACLPSHRLFETRTLPGNGGTAHAQKGNLGKPEEMLSQQTATVMELSAGKD